jgi:DNA-binding MarR family transcriptional regulator
MNDSVLPGRSSLRERASTDDSRSRPDPLLFSLMHAAHALERRLEEALEAVGLSMAKYGVLRNLAEANEPLTLSELAEQSACVRSNITQLVDRLEAEGLVQRVDDRSDRRIIRARLTAAGVERQVAGADAFTAVQAEFASAVPTRDRPALARLLSKLE